MQKVVATVAAIVGVEVAFFWIRAIGVMHYGVKLSPFWYGVMFITCPPIFLLRLELHWSLVPLVNAAIYGGIAWFTVRLKQWRGSQRPTKGSNAV